jgi:hypothetical protein
LSVRFAYLISFVTTTFSDALPFAEVGFSALAVHTNVSPSILEREAAAGLRLFPNSRAYSSRRALAKF